MRFFKWLSDFLDKASIWLLIIMTIVMSVGVFTQIVARNLFTASFEQLEEMSRFLLVWITFLGAAITYKHGGHLGVEFFVNALKGKIRAGALILMKVLNVTFFAMLIYYGFQMAQLTMRQSSLQMGIPIGIVYSILPISGVIMLVHTVDQFITGELQPENAPEITGGEA